MPEGRFEPLGGALFEVAQDSIDPLKIDAEALGDRSRLLPAPLIGEDPLAVLRGQIGEQLVRHVGNVAWRLWQWNGDPLDGARTDVRIRSCGITPMRQPWQLWVRAAALGWPHHRDEVMSQPSREARWSMASGP